VRFHCAASVKLARTFANSKFAISIMVILLVSFQMFVQFAKNQPLRFAFLVTTARTSKKKKYMEFKARDMPLVINKTIKSLFHREIGLLTSTYYFW
jgi:hypothetical protein